MLAYLQQAQEAGAALSTGVIVHEWTADGNGVEVKTSEGTFRAGSLVITVGAWAPRLLAGLGIPMEVRRKPLFWLTTRSRAHGMETGCPCFFYERPEGQFYGFPEMAAGEGSSSPVTRAVRSLPIPHGLIVVSMKPTSQKFVGL